MHFPQGSHARGAGRRGLGTKEVIAVWRGGGGWVGVMYASFGSRFSAVSTPPIAIIDLFFSIFRHLQVLVTLAPLQTQSFFIAKFAVVWRGNRPDFIFIFRNVEIMKSEKRILLF